MALGAVGLFTRSLPLLLAALFLGGVQSTLLGREVRHPSQQLRAELGGNALVETGTSLAVLFGMILGGWLIAEPGWGFAVSRSRLAPSPARSRLARDSRSAGGRSRAAHSLEPGLRDLAQPEQLTERRTVFSILGISGSGSAARASSRNFRISRMSRRRNMSSPCCS